MKGLRQREILNIIQDQNIDTQEQLLEALWARGFSATQATISRDIKDLRLIKELTGSGCYRYTVSEKKIPSAFDAPLRDIFKEGVVSVDAAQNIVVLRTIPGLASAACSALDNVEIEGMLGTLAGEDTGILIMRDNALAQRFSSEVNKLLE